MAIALVTGASRGIGLALTGELARRGWSVIATCRNPEAAADLQQLGVEHPSLRIEPLDVCDFDAVGALSERLQATPIDLLVNNAGVSAPAQLGNLDYAAWERVLRTNVLAPVRMVEAFLDHVAASEQKKIVALASSMGSIAASTGGSYIYRSSKAAMHMAMRSLAIDLRERGIIVGLISPGFVDTDFTRASRRPKLPVAESAAGVADACEALTLADSGRLIRYNGEEISW